MVRTLVVARPTRQRAGDVCFSLQPPPFGARLSTPRPRTGARGPGGAVGPAGWPMSLDRCGYHRSAPSATVSRTVVLSRTTNSVGRMIDGGKGKPLIFLNRRSAAISPSCRIGWRTVVSAG